MNKIEQNFNLPAESSQESNGFEIEGRHYTSEEIAKLGPILLEITKIIKKEITDVIPTEELLPGTNYLDLMKKLMIAAAKIELAKSEKE